MWSKQKPTYTSTWEDQDHDLDQHIEKITIRILEYKRLILLGGDTAN